jgi:hypothetical protein
LPCRDAGVADRDSKSNSAIDVVDVADINSRWSIAVDSEPAFQPGDEATECRMQSRTERGRTDHQSGDARRPIAVLE